MAKSKFDMDLAFEQKLADDVKIIDEYGKLSHSASHADCNDNNILFTDRIVVDDDWFMKICWERKDDRKKCNFCNLRFKCFTSRE